MSLSRLKITHWLQNSSTFFFVFKQQNEQKRRATPLPGIFLESYHQHPPHDSVQKCLRNNGIKGIKMRASNKREEANAGAREQLRCRGRPVGGRGGCSCCMDAAASHILLQQRARERKSRLIPPLHINNTNKNKNLHLKMLHHSALFQKAPFPR